MYTDGIFNLLKEIVMYYCFKEINMEEDDTPYDDGLTDAYVQEYEASLPQSDTVITEVEGYSDDALFESLRELED